MALTSNAAAFKRFEEFPLSFCRKRYNRNGESQHVIYGSVNDSYIHIINASRPQQMSHLDDKYFRSYQKFIDAAKNNGNFNTLQNQVGDLQNNYLVTVQVAAEYMVAVLDLAVNDDFIQQRAVAVLAESVYHKRKPCIFIQTLRGAKAKKETKAVIDYLKEKILQADPEAVVSYQNVSAELVKHYKNWLRLKGRKNTIFDDSYSHFKGREIDLQEQ